MGRDHSLRDRRSHLGRVLTETVVADSGWGPWIDRTWAIGDGFGLAFSDVTTHAFNDKWAVQGFETISLEGSVQVVAP
ncbi:MAG: hypothetical protein ACI9MR_000969 [Myxococcota bacterium]